MIATRKSTSTVTMSYDQFLNLLGTLYNLGADCYDMCDIFEAESCYIEDEDYTCTVFATSGDHPARFTVVSDNDCTEIEEILPHFKTEEQAGIVEDWSNEMGWGC